MRVGVIDVGANTLRLLVATGDGIGGVAGLHTTRVELGLGEDVELHGAIAEEKLERAEIAASEEAATARRLGCDVVEIVVTSPGRQAENAADLVASLARVTGAHVQVLSAEEEATYAYEGALACTPNLPESVAVCDVGGGSTQIVVGHRDGEPDWIRSLDLGSLRLTRRALHGDPPTATEIASAREIVDDLFAELTPPLPQAALATGGSARALRKLVGEELGPAELAHALDIAASRPARRLVKDYAVSPRRAGTVVAGALLLTAAQRVLSVPLLVARGGLREGVAARMLYRSAVAA